MRAISLPARRTLIGVAMLVAMAVALPAAAQPGGPAESDSACSYTRCALSIAPVWNGLALVRGSSGERVANLGFFWAGSLHRALPGADSAAWYGARAVRVRRTAAVFTNVGGVLAAYALGRRLGGDGLPRDGRVALAVGATALAVSVPLHFVADGHLSRAVWWHNRRYAR